ncbi:hypothetical protein AVANS_0239 [Campylobacter sp. RM5004]|uniref:hypothetical protein n=1 Tax=Campylobacter sp. RM5004 TaxID=1660078 RepID=UPI001EFAF22F|nr:hypothetical protein [Campylobacter sp. RM5004]ULO00883.1 hypothetical protein AVANS_0239 [Campylobacter sp. RM5004]
MQINSNLNIGFTNNIKVNNEVTKEIKQDSLKEQIANILKDAAQDEWGTYEPNAVLSKIGAYEKGSEIFNALESHLYKGILFYGSNPYEELPSNEEIFKYQKGDDARLSEFKLKAQVAFGIKTDSIYQKAYQGNASADEVKDLVQFLKDNSIEGLNLSGRFFKIPKEYSDEIMELFADESLSVDDFKQKYLEIKEKIESKKTNIDEINEEEQKIFKPIEAKSDNVRESMEEILSKIDPRKIKDERDLLALFLAYKDGENIYDKRV